MPRVALGVSYFGAPYHGWQIQAQVPSVQAELEKALTIMACQPVQTYCAGRTDAGVHALGQVVHFDTLSERPLLAWVRGTNAHLPPSVRVTWAKNVSADFHARFSATARTYQYWIANQAVASPIWHQRVLHFPYPLQVDKMHAAAQYFLGEQDFSAIRASECQSNTPWRCVQEAKVFQEGERICYQVTANAFVHHMVRNMVGLLLPVGQQHKSPEWVKEILASKDRRLAGITAPPEGLYLVSVTYPPKIL